METPKNFLGIPAEFDDAARSRFAILPVPYEKTTTYARGTAGGPAALLEASRQVELFDEELEQETWREGIHTAEPFVWDGEHAGMAAALARRYAELHGQGRVVAMLGGEHSITLGPILALKERYPKLSVLHVDAHGDLRDEYEGTRFGHGCVMRRVLEHVPIVQVGIRSLSTEEVEVIRRDPRVGTLFAHQYADGELPVKQVVDALTDDVYVSFDLDAFDPSLVPAVGTPEPGGLGWWQALRLLREATRRRRVVGFDVVELMPIPGQPASDFVAARLTYRMFGYLTRGA